VGIHAFDFARWVAGVDYIEVSAYHANLVHKERPGCQDVATVIARLANGGSATFNVDYLRPEAAATHGDDRLRVAGSRGVLEVRDEGRRLHVITAEADEANWPLEEHGRTFFGDFVGALEGTGKLLVGAEESFQITEFALKAAQAADERRIVSI
jgi:predicted dehydrogenase